MTATDRLARRAWACRLKIALDVLAELKGSHDMEAGEPEPDEPVDGWDDVAFHLEGALIQVMRADAITLTEILARAYPQPGPEPEPERPRSLNSPYHVCIRAFGHQPRTVPSMFGGDPASVLDGYAAALFPDARIESRPPKGPGVVARAALLGPDGGPAGWISVVDRSRQHHPTTTHQED